MGALTATTVKCVSSLGQAMRTFCFVFKRSFLSKRGSDHTCPAYNCADILYVMRLESLRDKVAAAGTRQG